MRGVDPLSPSLAMKEVRKRCCPPTYSRLVLETFDILVDAKGRNQDIEGILSTSRGNQMGIFLPQQILSVSELTQRIRFQLESNFEEVWVEGEVSNLKTPPSGHLYFTLKDEKSQLRAIIFRSQIGRFELQDGLLIICKGRITVYEPRGEYQIIIDWLEPKGIGALQLAFEQLKKRLEKEGLFAPSHKRPLPLLPQKIGIVTSPSGAAIRDLINIINRRYANITILIYPVKVQGEGASFEIAQAISEFNKMRDIDVIIIARGGGSLEDLWAFNEEIVARTIYESRIPIISAVGHEIDFTISDFVADLRAPTPSAAAELVVKNKIELLNSLKNLRNRLIRQIYQILEAFRSKLLIYKKGLVDPKRELESLKLREDELYNRLFSSIRRLLDSKREKISPKEKELTSTIHRRLQSIAQRLQQNMTQLDNLSPLNILRRGYSITRRLPSYRILREAQSLKPKDEVNVKLWEGELLCEVKEIFS